MSRFRLRENRRLPVQNIDTINPTNDILTPNQEGNTLIWFDTSLTLTNQNNLKTKKILRSAVDYVLLFNDEAKCIHYIESIDINNIFIVISGRSSTTLPKIHEIKQVKAICIFCSNAHRYKSLANDFSKVIGICTEQKELGTCLKNFIHSFLQQRSSINLMTKKFLEKTHVNAMEAYDFKKQQLMKEIILRIPRTEQSKQKLVDYCRFYYQGNETKLKEIDKFDTNYDAPHKAIEFYTSNSFWFERINQAFRIQDLESLEKFQLFITDLSQSLNHGFEQLKTSLSDQEILTLYRGQKFSVEEYRQFPSYGFVTFNSYISTSLDIKVAEVFGGYDAEETSSNGDLVSVLFEIEIDLTSLNNNTVVFADISKYSNINDECEYLFDIGATFEVISINDRKIKMIVSDKPHHVSMARLQNAYLYKYASQDIIYEIEDENESSMDNFSSSLLHIEKLLFKLNAFEEYIVKTLIDDENYQKASKYCIDAHIIPRIDPNSFYAIACCQINPDNPYADEYTDTYKQAIKHFQAFSEYASNEFMEWSLRALGYVYYQIDKYQDAQTYFIKALEMNDECLNVITCYYYLGCICGKLSNYEESMIYFDKILQMKDTVEPSFRAATYFQMAMYRNTDKEIYHLSQQTLKGEYLSSALELYKKTNEELFILKCQGELSTLQDYPSSKDECVKIFDRYYKYCQDQQIDLKPIIEVYERIGYSYYEDFEYDKALQCYMKTISYLPNKIPCHRIMADIYIKKKDSKLAIEHLKRTLELTNDLKIIVNCHYLIGLEYFKQCDFPMALECLIKSVQMCNDSDCNTKFNDYIFDFELERKSQIAKCNSMITSNNSDINQLYFCTEGLLFCLDLIKLFSQEILDFLKSIDRIRTSNYAEQIQRIMRENDFNNNNGNHLKKLVLETIFDNYIIMVNLCDNDDEALFYYTKALKIYNNSTTLRVIRDIEPTCTSKINSILQSNCSSDQFIEHMQGLLNLKQIQKKIKEEEDMFRNYFHEIKQNQLAKLYSHIGDIYAKMKNYEKAKSYFDKSMKYYETFPLLFHLEIADLYSRQGFIIHAQQTVNNDNVIFDTNVQELFKKAVETIQNTVYRKN